MSKKKDKDLDLGEELNEEELGAVSGGVSAADYISQGLSILGGKSSSSQDSSKIGGNSGSYYGSKR